MKFLLLALILMIISILPVGWDRPGNGARPWKGDVAGNLLGNYLARPKSSVYRYRRMPRAGNIPGPGCPNCEQVAKNAQDSIKEAGVAAKFDAVITVCDAAQEQCPFFPSPIRKLHVSFPDPGRAAGSADEIMATFRQMRDDIRNQLLPLLDAQT